MKKKKIIYKKMPSSVFTAALGVDARNWARAFCELTEGRPVDESMMLGWFANAIMAGFEEGQQRRK